MSRCTFGLPVLAALALAMATASAQAIDMTTFGESTEQGRVARYTTIIGSGTNCSSGFLTDVYNPSTEGYKMFQGVYDYVSNPGNFTHSKWWKMADGDTTAGSKGTTYDQYNGPDMVEDFVGYQFKHAATVSQINFANIAQSDGGTFAAAPRVEVLVGGPLDGTTPGTWTPIDVTGLEAYDTSLRSGTSNEVRPYTITPENSTGLVWGVRVIGEPFVSQPGLNDENGFIAVSEMQVSGQSSISNVVDLTTNLALNQTPFWSHETQYTRPEILTDGLYDNYDTTYENGDTDPTTETHYCGVLFSEAQSNVRAVGTTQKMFPGGGWLDPATTVVEYTTDPYDPFGNVEEMNWTAVTNLDMGRWPDTEPVLAELMLSVNRRYVHSELMTFDTISEAITGIRMLGDAYDVEGKSDPNGFLSCMEFEVFAAATVEIPGDTDGDTDVDATDAATMAGHWGETDVTAGAAHGDFNLDGVVDMLDASILAANWTGTIYESQGESVPEPSTIIVMFGGLLLLVVRRGVR